MLWDSLSRNLGDQAIGPCLLRLARRAGFERLAPVPIGAPIAESFDLLVIGGGELLHPPGHPYYDLFRVPGPHILNTVGTGGSLDAAYLSSYRLVSVRSEADRQNLEGLDHEVRVAPCLTVLFDRVAEAGEPIELPAAAVGVHLHSSSFRLGESAQVLEVLRQLGDRTVLVPFTHYNRDHEIQAVIAQQLGLPAPLPIGTPDQAFDVIRRLGALVTTSLHATIMAYIAGVPFLAIDYASKVARFLRERELSHRLVASFAEVGSRLDLLRSSSVEWQDRLASDRRRAGDLLDAILAELEDASSRRPRRPRSFTRWREPAYARQSHALMMRTHELYGLRIAERLAHGYDRQRFEGQAGALQAHLRQVEQELEKAGDYARSLERRLEQPVEVPPVEVPPVEDRTGDESP
ncbi:MAG TPA: polysaccharide pyruvyl transferase family protein [Thermoanaerobaculia bacterium]|nr:polysaccharide pyruvyl transferase family protein [Thermoanaerobaculia bacterium]